MLQLICNRFCGCGIKFLRGLFHRRGVARGALSAQRSHHWPWRLIAMADMRAMAPRLRPNCWGLEIPWHFYGTSRFTHSIDPFG